MAEGVFHVNRENAYYFKFAGDEAPTRIDEGIKTITPNPTETVVTDEYYHGTETDVLARREQFDFAGERMKGNPGQDKVAALSGKTGDDRHGIFYWKDVDGDVWEAESTITNIVASGGDANTKGTFTFSVMCNEPLKQSVLPA